MEILFQGIGCFRFRIVRLGIVRVDQGQSFYRNRTHQDGGAALGGGDGFLDIGIGEIRDECVIAFLVDVL